MKLMFFGRCVTAISVLIWLTACTTAPPAPQDAASSLQWPELDPPDNADFYRIDRDESLVHIRVDAAGSMARFGHSHIIGGSVIDGEIFRTSALSASRIDLVIDVGALDVDRPEWRAEHGLEPELDESAIAGTRANLLGPEVLGAEQFPEIRMRSVSISGPSWAPVITARIALRDQVAEFEIPVGLHEDGSQITAIGRFAFNHSDFGLQPFSALGGALAVSERIEVWFRLVAQADTWTVGDALSEP